jgi:hypothetical protein
MNKENVPYINNGVFLSIKNKEMMSFAGKWTELEIITVSEISQTQKDKYQKRQTNITFSLMYGI